MNTAARSPCLALVCLAAFMLVALPARASDPVVAAADPDVLFHSPDPRLDANKQVAYHIVKDLLEANHWDLAPRYLTERYLQHNPNARSGRQGVVDFFTKVLKVQPQPPTAKLRGRNIVAVVAEGDLVTVLTVRAMPAQAGAEAYTTTWFDTWRIQDGKADEHWDPATR